MKICNKCFRTGGRHWRECPHYRDASEESKDADDERRLAEDLAYVEIIQKPYVPAHWKNGWLVIDSRDVWRARRELLAILRGG